MIMVASLSATLVFRKAKKVYRPLAMVLESVTALGGFIGALSSAGFSAQAAVFGSRGVCLAAHDS